MAIKYYFSRGSVVIVHQISIALSHRSTGMPRFLQVAILLVFCFCLVEALKCDRCEGNPDTCAVSERTEECDNYGPDQMCANFFYWSAGSPVVQKGCYQSTSCKTQASRVDNYCGEHDGKDKPCRCCCTRNRCNRLRKGCIVPSKCGKPKQPKIGKYLCPAKTRLGSVCNFTCPANYDLIGPKTTRCSKSGATGKLRWSPLGQNCGRLRCPKLKPPKNGKMKCTNKGKYKDLTGDNYVNTECDFECDFGYKLVGDTSTTCKRNQKWTHEVPKCVVDPCEPFPKNPNRIDTCTNGNMLGSVCTFRCKVGKLVGPEKIECMLDEKDLKSKEWSKDPPACISVKCLPKQDDPVNGEVSCTDENSENSVCTFSCDYGHDIDGTEKKTTTPKCEDDNDGDDLGVWSHPPATCSRFECNPRLENPASGTVECTDRNLLDSVCTYKCNYGYDMDGTAKKTVKSVCQDDGDGDADGEWSFYPPPTCTKIRCEPPHEAPENGKMTCSDVNNLGSFCSFRCDEYYDMDKTMEDTLSSECEDDEDGNSLGKWSREPPTCTIIKCRPIRKPAHSTYKCTNGNTIGSACDFECDFGYKRVGERSIICKDQKRDGDSVGEWSGEEPKCRQVFCEAQEHDDTVTRQCDPESEEIFEVSTVCKYQCIKRGYYMVEYEEPKDVVTSGFLDVKCLPTGQWDRGAPRCVPIKCPEIKQPVNGHSPSCSNDRWVASVCKFNCLPKHGLSHEEDIVCESDGSDSDKVGKWSREPPTCEKNECDDFGQVNNGKITYTNHLKIGSVAHLVCNSGYTYKQYEDTECLPAGEGRRVPDWSRRRNVCCVKCIFNKRLRIISVVDKTAADNGNDWNHIVTWHYYLLDDVFTKGYDVKFGMVLYDMKADEKNSLDERLLKSFSDVEDVRYAMHDLPHGGKGSNTAQALEYATEEYFSRYGAAVTSRRPRDEPYLILVKSPHSSGDTSAISHELQQRKIHVMALGFKRGDWEREEKDLISITKNDTTVVMVGGLGDLRRAGEVITEISKEKGCSLSSRNAPCT